MSACRHVLLSLLLVCTVNVATAAIEVANVTGGRIKGEVQSDLTVFKAVPFAAPPVGALRWQPPQPVLPWQGIREEKNYAPACMQDLWPGAPPASEDCLYLNVWTSAKTAKERRPVMVWIHGGGLTDGFSWAEVAYGNHLAPEGVVLVNLAYRLGPFGFIAHPDLTRESGKGSGNYGLRDVIAALKWVQANIAQFGGDPKNVTINGMSSGATIVTVLMASPSTQGLYARAIAQGGGGFYGHFNPDREGFPVPTLSEAEQRGVAFFKSVNVTDLKTARDLPAEKWLRASKSPNTPFSANMIVDGEVLPDYDRKRFEAGGFVDVPLLLGHTSDEGGIYPEWMAAQVAKSPCAEARAAIKAAYPGDESSRYLWRDLGDGWPMWSMARLQTKRHRHPAYFYFFDAHDPEHAFGAWHAEDFPYVFGNFDKPSTPKQQGLSKLMRQYWINFATRGDPNGPGLPVWKAFDDNSHFAMVFAETQKSQPLPNLKGLRAVDLFMRCGGG